MRTLQKVVGLGIVLSFLCLFLFPTLTYAHAYLQKSTPTANEIISQSPAKIMLQFNESIQPAFHDIQVTNSAGERVDLDDSYIPDSQLNTLEGNVSPNLPDGVYVVKWNVISGDGHRIEGSIPFQVGDGSSSVIVPTAQSASTFPGLDLIAIRWLLYLSMSFFMGILCFYRFMYPANPKGALPLPRRSRTLLWITYGGILVSILLSLPLQATIDARIQWTELWATPWLAQMFQTNFGLIWLIQLGLAIVLGGVIYAAHRISGGSRLRIIGYSLALSLALGILLSKSFIGHPAASELKVLSITMNFLHLAAICVWIGSLLALAIVLPGEASLPTSTEERKGTISRVIRTFSCWGFGLVAIVILSGIYASLKYVPTLYSLFNTSYGQVLLLKCGLVLIMLVFAAVNFLRGRKNKPVGRSVWIELSIGVITLVLAAILTNLPTATGTPGPVHVSNSLDSGEVISLRISPNIVGNNQFEIDVRDAKGQEIHNIQQVKLTLTSLDMDMGKYEIIVPYEPNSTFMAKDLISMAGRWNIQVHILSASLDSWDTDFTIRVGTK
ncbi:copper resistance CopC/CopD family protein [Paenibacillus sp. FA6]|uniref:copper resistance CopC/CopD family protein n=1 Tax=Paenibacillus sp. FA6 TaxID=3413029 RepID=UPI003F655B20